MPILVARPARCASLLLVLFLGLSTLAAGPALAQDVAGRAGGVAVPADEVKAWLGVGYGTVRRQIANFVSACNYWTRRLDGARDGGDAGQAGV
ncbi:hypothetical protein [Xanthobacter oligotrophicus]|uniref:hypothetical protein n=1 Tax=Xanthobacter oligotrophicus TaxID=2607286 RepID=UPI0011F3CA0D|nr:hypothetical protein [Xanthobacter oligotrophicus]MCG5237940.1 hypothetical protein [Xanthobacter oligotrophicus]